MYLLYFERTLIALEVLEHLCYILMSIATIWGICDIYKLVKKR